MHCKAQTTATAIARLWRGFATLQGAQSEVLRATRDLFSVALIPPLHLEICCGSLFVCFFCCSVFTEISGVKYPTIQQVANAQLVLNGAGVRTKMLFKVYAAGLYLGSKISMPEEVISAPGPKRVHVVMLRDIDANELGRMFTRAMQNNASRDDFAKAATGTLRLGDIFAAKKKLTAGEYFSIDWLPGVGTVILINNKPAGEPIKEPELYTSLLKIWLGKAPVDVQLKAALLGGTTEVPQNPGN
jgi:hypothetical protein